MFPTHGYDFVQWTRGQRKLYESNYLKANSPDGRRGLWIKHNILAPASKRHQPVLELWCVWFDRDAEGPPIALKQEVPMGRVAAAKTGLRIEGEGLLLTDRETRTQLTDASGREASWDLSFEPSEPILFHLPHARLYRGPFPKKKLTTPAPRLQFNGWLEIDGTRHEIKDWTGLRGHNWGTEHAWAYAYGNCNLFQEDEQAVLDMFTAKIKIGPIKSPWLSMGVLRVGGREYGINRLRHAITTSAVVDFPRWRVQIPSSYGTLETEWALDPADTIGLRYLHPDGKVSYCYNTKFAEVTVRFGDVHLTSDQAELEFLFAEPIPGIALHGGTELPSI